MKKILSLTLALSMLISVMPYTAFAEDTAYGLSGNPIVIDMDTSAFYEMENYPIEGKKLVLSENDTLASGGKSIAINSMSTDATDATVRLSIDTTGIHKIKMFARMMTKSSNHLARVSVAKNSDNILERPFFLEEINKYYWVCLDSYELDLDEDITFTIEFNASATYLDKLFITGDIHEFPVDMSGTTNEIDMSYMSDYYPAPDYYPIKGHPRVFLNKDTLPKIRQNLTNPENKIAYDSVTANATTVPDGIEFSKSLKYMLSNAFLSVVEEDATLKEEYANKSITALFNALSVKSELKSNRETREDHVARAYRLHIISLVYDWCYDYLSDEQKEELFSEILFYLAQYEMTYPPALTHGSINGHISEAEVFLGLLSTSLAFYDEYPDMYKVIGGKLFEESIYARNYYYEHINHTQGTNYISTRMVSEFHLFSLLETGLGIEIMEDGADEILMEYIYGRRPDSLMFRNGDSNGPTSYRANLSSLFFFSNYLKNGYLKDEFERQYPSVTLGYAANGLSDYLWLIFNDTEVTGKSYKELPLTRYAGNDSGVMYARTSWEMGEGDNSNAMAVRLNLETIFGGGHDHLDAGHFDIYYKGALALDSGFYPGTDELHHRNYFKRTVAHNTMLLYDPDEYMANRYSGSINDGGQKYLEISSFPTKEQFEEEQKIGEILAVDYGEDMYSPSFSYLKGDLTKAYATDGDKEKVHNSDKMKKYTRSFVFLNFFDDVYPGALIVFDKMTSNNPLFKKTWLLHTQDEPQINGGTIVASKTDNLDNGRLINTTLLPKAEDREIIKIGGTGKEFMVNGTNYPTNDRFENNASNHTNDFGKWRIELSPKESKETDYFLNVLHVTENDNTIPLLQPELIEAGDFVGVKIKDRIALFGLNDTRYEDDVTFEISGEGEFEILVTDIKEGAWDIYKNGTLYTEKYATEDGGNLVFKGEKGTYTLKKDKSDFQTFKRNLNYLDYVKPLSETPKYIRINEAYCDIPYITKNELLYVESERFSEVADCDYEYENGNLKFTHSEYSLIIPVSSEQVDLIDGKYYVDLYALRDLYYITYTRPLDDIYTVTLNKRNVTKITTGAQFAGLTFNDRELYVIEGTETLNDKTKGIVLPENYACAGKTLKGVITGIDGFNNIQLTSNTPLFNNTPANAYIAINNINLKGPNSDGSGNIELSTDYVGTGIKANGVLINNSTGAFDLEIKNVNNYVNITSENSTKPGIAFAGGLIGRRLSGTTLIENCNNFGNVDGKNLQSGSDYKFPAAGGIIGNLYYGSAGTTKLIIKNTKNFGNISVGSYMAGGILGNNVGEDVIIDISLCANYGDITSTNSSGTGGIIGACAATTVIKETFNAGRITSSRYAAGILGASYIEVGSTAIGTGANSTFTVENSFNVGEITGSYTAGIMRYRVGTPVVRNCYNVGSVSGTNAAEITNATSENCYGNYHINTEKNDEQYIKKEEVATELPFGFSKVVWEYSFNDESNMYSLPQIIGNNFVYNKDESFYVEKYQVDITTLNGQFTNEMILEEDFKPTDTKTGEEISTAYVIVPARFRVSLGVAKNFSYGMIISKTHSGDNLTIDTASKVAEAKKNVSGAYGILFYGNMTAGDTYYVRPYVLYNGNYTYGETTFFVFPSKKKYGLNDWILDNSMGSYTDSLTAFEY